MARHPALCALAVLHLMLGAGVYGDTSRPDKASEASRQRHLHELKRALKCPAPCAPANVRAKRAPRRACAPATSSSARREALPRCLLVVDRHVQKTAGTTVRRAFQLAEAQGWCRYWGYQLSVAGFGRLLKQLAARRAQERFRVCVEAHVAFERMQLVRSKSTGRRYKRGPQMLTRLLSPLHALRDSGRANCTLVSSLRLREPVEFYRSYYEWAVAGLVFETERPCAEEGPQAASGLRAAAPAEPALGGGDDDNAAPGCTATDFFVRWVRLAPNLQALSLAHGFGARAWMDCNALDRDCIWSSKPNAEGYAPPRGLSLAGLDAVMATVRAADVALPLEELPLFLAALRRASALPALPSAHVVPTPLAEESEYGCRVAPTRNSMDGGVRRQCREDAQRAPARPCRTPAERARCASVVRAHAPHDRALYELVTRRAQALRAADVSGTLRASAARLARPAGNGSVWMGSEPSPARCSVRVVKRAKGQGVVLPPLPLPGAERTDECAVVPAEVERLIYMDQPVPRERTLRPCGGATSR